MTENKEPISSPVSDFVSVERLRINHYWSKSLEDLRKKIDKGRVASDSRKNPSKNSLDVALARDAAASGETDTSAVRFADATRATIAHYRDHYDPTRPPPPPKRLRYTPLQWLKAENARLRRRVRKALRRRSR